MDIKNVVAHLKRSLAKTSHLIFMTKTAEDLGEAPKRKTSSSKKNVRVRKHSS